jgi:hypothetical protein
LVLKKIKLPSTIGIEHQPRTLMLDLVAKAAEAALRDSQLAKGGRRIEFRNIAEVWRSHFVHIFSE